MTERGPASQLHVEPAAAKVNLTLRILGRRPDGYHEVESLVAFASIGDRLTLTRPAHPASSSRRQAAIELTGPFAASIVGENLVAKALARIEAITGRTLATHILLEKNLPVAAGVGGGSADAAALIRAIAAAYPDLPALDLPSLARSLGADVPVCLTSSPAWMTGIGETLTPVALPHLALVLANPMIEMPPDKTRRVFEALAAAPLATSRMTERPATTVFAHAGLIELMLACGNDLERPALALFPAIAEVKRALSAAPGCAACVLSGAGPTVVGVFESDAAAKTAANSIASEHGAWWVRASTTLEQP